MMKRLIFLFSVLCVGVLWITRTQIYFNYRTKLHVTEGYVLAKDFEVPMEEFYQTHQHWPNYQEIQNNISLKSKTTSIVASTQIAPNGTIVALFSENLNLPLRIKIIELTPLVQSNGEILWQCSSNIENMYLPLFCQNQN